MKQAKESPSDYEKYTLIVNHTQEAVDRLTINPSGRLATTLNKNKFSKIKDCLNRNPQSQTSSSDLLPGPGF
jgi:hypothetical protein